MKTWRKFRDCKYDLRNWNDLINWVFDKSCGFSWSIEGLVSMDGLDTKLVQQRRGKSSGKNPTFPNLQHVSKQPQLFENNKDPPNMEAWKRGKKWNSFSALFPSRSGRCFVSVNRVNSSKEEMATEERKKIIFNCVVSGRLKTEHNRKWM